MDSYICMRETKITWIFKEKIVYLYNKDNKNEINSKT
jgi:hypothetical protein